MKHVIVRSSNPWVSWVFDFLVYFVGEVLAYEFQEFLNLINPVCLAHYSISPSFFSQDCFFQGHDVGVVGQDFIEFLFYLHVIFVGLFVFGLKDIFS